MSRRLTWLSALCPLLSASSAQSRRASEEAYNFGSNWESFLNDISNRGELNMALHIADARLLNFLSPQGQHLRGAGASDVADEAVLRDLTFLDIGSGSGLHSAAAFISQAKRVISFDKQDQSVLSTQSLKERLSMEDPSRWENYVGDILERGDLKSLIADVVYSWGVLHHTGDIWTAIENACSTVKPAELGGGVMFLALYAREVIPDPEYWIRIKKMYLRADQDVRWLMERAYGWWLLKDEVLSKKRNPFALAFDAQLQRGMNFWTDVRDWLGGYPIEFSETVEVIRFVRERCGLIPARVDPGTVTEYLFVTPLRENRGRLVAEWHDELAKMQAQLLPLDDFFPLPLNWPRSKCFLAQIPKRLLTFEGPNLKSLRFDVFEDGLPYGFGVETGIEPPQGIRSLEELAMSFLEEDLNARFPTREWQARFGSDGNSCSRPGRYFREVFFVNFTPMVVFSTSDGSDPNKNGRIYSLRLDEATVEVQETVVENVIKVPAHADLDFTSF